MKCYQDQSFVKGVLPKHLYKIESNSNKNQSFKILGGGRCSFSKPIKIDLALNLSENKNTTVYSRFFELPDDKDPAYGIYKRKLKAFDEKAEKLIYRSSIRDRDIWQSFTDELVNITYLKEIRTVRDPVYALNCVDTKSDCYPFYTSSLIAALLYAYRTQKPKIELFGFELGHNTQHHRNRHKTLKLINGENIITHTYKLCYELEKRGRKVIFHPPSSFENIFK